MAGLGFYHSFIKRPSGEPAASFYRAQQRNHCSQVVGAEIEQWSSPFLVIEIGIRVVTLNPMGTGKSRDTCRFTNQTFINEPTAGLHPTAQKGVWGITH